MIVTERIEIRHGTRGVRREIFLNKSQDQIESREEGVEDFC